MAYYERTTTILKVRRSDLQPDDIILRPAPSDLRIARIQQPRDRDLPAIRPPRPGYLRRTSSLDRDNFPAPYRGRGPVSRRRTISRGQSDEDQYDRRSLDRRRRIRRRDQPDSRAQYDSEGSIPPRSRRSKGSKQKRQQSNRNGNTSSSSSSSSDLGCTDDDEKIKKKAKWKKWGAIGLAGVATIHAVHGAHETMERTKARHKEYAEGEISKEEAEKKKKNAKWKTAADVGIAAVWIKSAYDEIKEYREAKKEHNEVCEKSEERHRERIERAKAIECGEYHGHHPLDHYEKYLTDGNNH